MPSRGSLGPERGSVAVAMVGGVAVVMIFIIGLTDMAVFVLARTRAQTAADSASLAAAAELIPGLGVAPEAKAREFATANGATLTSCECSLGSTEAVVTVTVPVNLTLSGLSGIKEVKAASRAEINLPGFLFPPG